MRRSLGILATLALAGGTIVSFAPATAAAPGGPGNDRTGLAWQRPAWVATAGPARAVTPSDPPITVRVYLQWRDLAGAHAAAEAVSDPTSTRYRHYLTAAQVRTAYGPTIGAEQRVTRWLADAGLTVGTVPDNALYVSATGSAVAVSAAFATSIDAYARGSRRLHAANGAPSTPAAVSADIAGVSGLDSTVARRIPGTTTDRDRTISTPRPASAAVSATAAVPKVAPPTPGFRNAPPCSQYWAQRLDVADPKFKGVPNPMPYVPCGYLPGQLRSAYGIDHAVASGNTGRLVRVAIVDAYASPTLRADAKTYAQRYDSEHPLSNSQYSQLVFPETDPSLEAPDQCDASGWYGEQTLDVEAVHATAPGASILYVGAASCLDDDINVALNDVVVHHRADIVSNSYGNSGEDDIPPAEFAAFDAITAQAALEGIGIYFSSGDDGDQVANLGHPSPDYSATSSMVTAVGGTSLGVDARGHTVVERGWETGLAALGAGKWSPRYPGDFLYGSGGGVSKLYAEPSYQRAVVPDRLARIGRGRGRVVPDVAILGDPNTGMLIGQTQTFSDGVAFDVLRIGGTSLSSPLFAGVMALADQRAGYAHGFANPALYRLYHSGAYTDVTAGGALAMVRVNYANGENAADGTSTSARVIDDPNLTIHTGVGYDNVTGMGTPWGPTFLSLMGAR